MSLNFCETKKDRLKVLLLSGMKHYDITCHHSKHTASKVKKRLIVADKLSGGMLAQRLSAVYNSAKISCYKSELLIQCYKNQNISLHCVGKNLGEIK